MSEVRQAEGADDVLVLRQLPGEPRLGRGDDIDRAPKVVKALQGEHVVTVAAGDTHSLCVLESGRVFGWGSGQDERLGLGLVLGNHQFAPKAYAHSCAAVVGPLV